MSYQALLGLQAQHDRPGTGGDDDRVGGVRWLGDLRVADPDAEWALAEVHLGHLGGDDLRSEAGGLGAHVGHELRAHNPLREAGEVLHLGGQHELATRLVAGRRRLSLDHQRSQVGTGGVNGGRQPGRTGSNDDDFVV